MTFAIVPARGGSTELKRKNLLPVGGTPMFLRSAQAAKDAGCDVVVSTDDPEIRSVAIAAGFEVHDRGPELADVPVDEVVKAAIPDGYQGSVLLVQPTVQPMTTFTICNFLTAVSTPSKWTTGLQDEPLESAALVQYTGHQYWQDGECLTERVNRQDRHKPAKWMYQELGVRWWLTPDQIGGVPLHQIGFDYPLVDIDTAADYRSVTIPKRIALWPISDDQHGRGHLHRCLAIAERLQHHDIRFVTTDLDEDAARLIQNRGWQVWHPPFPSYTAECADDKQVSCPDIVDLLIMDNLGTRSLSNHGPALSLEDPYGAGDVTINALYEDGPDWCVLRPEFTTGNYQVRYEVKNILLLFGGTDPSGLGDRLYDLLTQQPEPVVRRIWPESDVSVAEMMHQADLLITSAGRTVFEASAVGIPTIVLAQNLRETTHTHLGYEHGNIYLGLGKLVTDRKTLDTVQQVAANYDLRRELSERGRPDGKGLDRIVHRIEGMLKGL